MKYRVTYKPKRRWWQRKGEAVVRDCSSIEGVLGMVERINERNTGKSEYRIIIEKLERLVDEMLE